MALLSCLHELTSTHFVLTNCVSHEYLPHLATCILTSLIVHHQPIQQLFKCNEVHAATCTGRIKVSLRLPLGQRLWLTQEPGVWQPMVVMLHCVLMCRYSVGRPTFPSKEQMLCAGSQ